MEGRGFIFSLDAFVSFVIIMVIVSLFIFTIGTPKAFYPSLEQAQQLAYDTLQVLATSTDDASQGTYLEQIIGPGGADTKTIMYRVAGGNDAYSASPIIPKGYGYRLETLNFNDGTWAKKFDSADPPDSDRRGKSFSKLQASATTFLSLYTVQPEPGKSPFCHLGCQGFGRPENTPCNVTPCDVPTSLFNPGENSVQLVRLIVYT